MRKGFTKAFMSPVSRDDRASLGARAANDPYIQFQLWVGGIILQRPTMLCENRVVLSVRNGIWSPVCYSDSFVALTPGLAQHMCSWHCTDPPAILPSRALRCIRPLAAVARWFTHGHTSMDTYHLYGLGSSYHWDDICGVGPKYCRPLGGWLDTRGHRRLDSRVCWALQRD